MSFTKHTNHVSIMNVKCISIMPTSFLMDLTNTACVAVFHELD